MRTDTIDEPSEHSEVAPIEERPRRAAYTVHDVAALLGLSPGTTYALVRSGAIPARRMGARWIVPKRRFHRWLDGQVAQ